MLENGIDAEFINTKLQIGKKPLKKNFSSLFATGLNESAKADKEFSRITTIKNDLRDSTYDSNDYFPILSLGTIVRDCKNQYLLCVQPSCDCVRITEDEESRNFPFIPMMPPGDKNPDCVIWDINSEDNIGLKIIYKPYEMTMIAFAPDDDGSQVVKAKGDKGFNFKAINRRQFEWVADLKRDFALRISQKLANQLARIGLDEFELFR